MTRFRFRYDLPVGERFTIAASSHERIDVGNRPLVDLHASFALNCEVAACDAAGAAFDGTRQCALGTVGGRVEPRPARGRPAGIPAQGWANWNRPAHGSVVTDSAEPGLGRARASPGA